VEKKHKRVLEINDLLIFFFRNTINVFS